MELSRNTATPHGRSRPGNPATAPRTRANHVSPSRKIWLTFVLFRASHTYKSDAAFETNLVAFLVAFCQTREDSTQHLLNSCEDINTYFMKHTQLGDDEKQKLTPAKEIRKNKVLRYDNIYIYTYICIYIYTYIYIYR